MFLVADGALNNAHVDRRDFLYVGDRAGGELDQFGQINEAFVQVQKRHVAPRTTAQPGRRHFNFRFLAHENSVSRITLSSRASPRGGNTGRNGNVRPSKLVIVPDFSHQIAAGNTTCARSVRAER